MPITFEEVTAEVLGDRPAPPDASNTGAQTEPTGDAAAEPVLRALALRAEREWRNRAD